jgi:hypothetical protein
MPGLMALTHLPQAAAKLLDRVVLHAGKMKGKDESRTRIVMA